MRCTTPSQRFERGASAPDTRLPGCQDAASDSPKLAWNMASADRMSKPPKPPPGRAKDVIAEPPRSYAARF